VATVIDELKVDLAACGSNCGVGPSETVLSIINLKNALEDKPILVVAKGNCGIPYYDNGKIEYDGTPELMASYARFARRAGATIIGGCCGTTPEHLRAMKLALDDYEVAPKPTLDEVVSVLGEVSTGARAQYSGNLAVSAGSASGAGARKSRRNKG
jgi:5-methyltetrahydrofolate--homocysteine methyltransferase